MEGRGALTLQCRLIVDNVADPFGRGARKPLGDAEAGSNGPGRAAAPAFVDRRAIAKLSTAIFLCVIFAAVEVVGGYLSHSLAIMTDAAHLLSDVGGFLLSLLGIAMATRGANRHMTFGYQRIEIIAALLSIMIVWLMTAFLLHEAVGRIREPQPINGPMMAALALFGLLVNVGIIAVLHQPHAAPHSHGGHACGGEEAASPHSDETGTARNINVRAAFIHALGDIIQSVGVLLASLVIWWRPAWTIADPICTIAFALIVFASTYYIARDAILILLEGAPASVHQEELVRALLAIPSVVEVHDLHMWTLVPGRIVATVHVIIQWRGASGESDAAAYERVLLASQEIFCRAGIHHATVQIDPLRHLDEMHCRVNCCGSTGDLTAASIASTATL